jgi:UDP-glucose 4-epimerase
MMKALVTGGAGFIGSYLVPALIKKGFEVIVFDHAPDPILLSDVQDKITYFRGDLASETDLYRAMTRHKITDVFHLGAVLAEACEENPLNGFKINFQSTLVLLDASVSLNVRRFVMISSISVFGKDVPEPVPDDAPKNPATVYGQTKLACEHALHWYARNCGLDTRALRFTWVFGPGRTTGITALYSSLLLDAIARGEPLAVTNPDETGDWLYVKDAVKALLALWEAKDPLQRMYNIAGGVHSIRDVIELAKKYKPDSHVTYQNGGTTSSPYPSSYDDRVAKKEIGWRPDYTIDEAVQEHISAVSQLSH